MPEVILVTYDNNSGSVRITIKNVHLMFVISGKT